MSVPSSGEIRASVIGAEFGRAEGTIFSIYDARNGSYGAINNCSGKRPTANGQSGYEFSDWRGYDHNASCPTILTYMFENSSDVNIRYYAYDNYGVNYINEFWYYGNVKGANLASDTGTTIRQNDQIDVLWAWLGWGDYYQYTKKYVYSASRGILYDGSGYAGDSVSTTFYPESGEYIEVWGEN